MSRVNDYYGKCATCTGYMLCSTPNLGRTSSLAAINGVGFRCARYGQNFTLGDHCGHFSYNRRVTDKNICDAEKMINNSKIRFYVATAVVEILGDNNFYNLLYELREFRARYMEKNPEFKSFLDYYDIVGPRIVEELKKDDHKDEVAKSLLYDYLLPCGVIIEFGDVLKYGEANVPDERNYEYEKAAKLFIKMVNELVNFYDVEEKLAKEMFGEEIDRGESRKRTNKDYE